MISATQCLQTNGKAAYFLANETTQQSISFAIDTGFPPAVTISAGVTRTGDTSQPPFFHALASFGVVYFDEISAYTTSGSRSLTSGDAITMVNQNGKILARPVRLNDFAFKTVFVSGTLIDCRSRNLVPKGHEKRSGDIPEHRPLTQPVHA